MKKYVIGFILGAIIFGSIGVAAAGLFASDITYTPKEGWTLEENTVEKAIDDLYDRSVLDLTTDFRYSIGHRTGPKTMSIDLTKGEYILVFTSSYSWPSGSFNQSISDNIEESMNSTNCTSLIKKKITNFLSSSNQAHFTTTAVYRCNISSNETVSLSHSHNVAPDMSENFLLYSIKLH